MSFLKQSVVRDHGYKTAPSSLMFLQRVLKMMNSPDMYVNLLVVMEITCIDWWAGVYTFNRSQRPDLFSWHLDKHWEMSLGESVNIANRFHCLANWAFFFLFFFFCFPKLIKYTLLFEGISFTSTKVTLRRNSSENCVFLLISTTTCIIIILWKLAHHKCPKSPAITNRLPKCTCACRKYLQPAVIFIPQTIIAVWVQFSRN